jgi:hypothetical protein
MRRTVLAQVNYGRLRDGLWASDPSYGHNGVFNIQGPCGAVLRIVASDGEDPDAEGWEHVSVSTGRRCPNWIEMCFVKRLFWDDEETVLQFHPPSSVYVNNHPNCLHLWRHRTEEVRLPPTQLVGRYIEGAQ